MLKVGSEAEESFHVEGGAYGMVVEEWHHHCCKRRRMVDAVLPRFFSLTFLRVDGSGLTKFSHPRVLRCVGWTGQAVGPCTRTTPSAPTTEWRQRAVGGGRYAVVAGLEAVPFTAWGWESVKALTALVPHVHVRRNSCNRSSTGSRRARALLGKVWARTGRI